MDSLFTKCLFVGQGDQKAVEVEQSNKNPQTKQNLPILYDLFC